MVERRNVSGPIGALVQVAGHRGMAWLVLLSLVGAASEGLGFVLLVPLLAHAGGASMELPLGLEPPDIPLSLLLTGFVILVCLRAGAEVARRLATQALRVRIVDGLRMQAVDGLLNARWRWLSGLRRGENEALLITNIDRVGYGVELVGGLVRLSLALMALGAAALVISPRAALTGAAAGALVLLLFWPLRKRARLIGAALSRRYEMLYSHLGETLASLRVIKSYGREEGTVRDLDSRLGELRKVERAYVRDTAWAHAALQIGGAFVAAALAWFALDTLAMPLPILLPLAAIFVRALPLLSELQTSWQGWSHEMPALEQTVALIDTAREHREADMGAGEIRLRREITLRQVSVSHRPGHPVLDSIDMSIPARRLIVLTGASGAGKSTLADVIAGLAAPDKGEIFIDGTTMTAANRRGWRLRVAYVQQDAVLFSGTVRDNLLWANPDADDALIAKAIAEASADFVHALPEGIDCDLGEGGRALSGGERQRIALARALMREPDLIILDEATSAIDAVSEQDIAAALHAMTEHRTVIAIAHRGLLREIADQTIRLEKGRIAAR